MGMFLSMDAAKGYCSWVAVWEQIWAKVSRDGLDAGEVEKSRESPMSERRPFEVSW